MDEILYELRDHSYGLNAGRWDYIFSMIKCFRDRPDFVLPDRNDVKMTVPFMRAYTELLVKTCHAPRRVRDGRHGRADPVAQGRGGQRAGDRRGARGQGARGRGRLRRHLGRAPGRRRRRDWRRSTPCSATSPNQIDKQRDDVDVDAPTQLLDAASTPGEITEEGLRSDVNVGFQYISFWLGGRGAAGHQQPDGGRRHRRDLALADLAVDPPRQVHARARARGARRGDGRRSAPRSATRCGRRAAPTRRARSSSASRSRDDFPEFLTLPAYEYLD